MINSKIKKKFLLVVLLRIFFSAYYQMVLN